MNNRLVCFEHSYSVAFELADSTDVLFSLSRFSRFVPLLTDINIYNGWLFAGASGSSRGCQGSASKSRHVCCHRCRHDRPIRGAWNGGHIRQQGNLHLSHVGVHEENAEGVHLPTKRRYHHCGRNSRSLRSAPETFNRLSQDSLH